MPYFLSIGVSKEEFLDSTPKDLECYHDAEIIREKRADRERWHMGMYNLNAFSVALSMALTGKKSKAKYMDKPLLEESNQIPDEELTEEQIKQERQKLLMALKVSQANFELNKGKVDE